MNKIILLLFLIFSLNLIANDGAYYASGNHLIPIKESDISVTKEILTVTQKGGFIYVVVDYTFYNPIKEKNIIVGFEAPSPSGDVDGYPINGGHPYIHDFKVLMNGKKLNFKKAIVNEENYYKDGKINNKTEKEAIGEDFNSNEPEFYYVYHFNAKFKKGENKIIHTYKFKTSGGIMERYNFNYILTAVNRWANNGIDDFTLNIDMGKNTSYTIRNTFCKSNEWSISNGRKINNYNDNSTGFSIINGKIQFKKKKFSPKGELYLSSPRTEYAFNTRDVFNFSTNNLPSKIKKWNEEFNLTTKSINDKSYKILRNLPFAIKGYVFKTEFVKDYYMNQIWYKPDPNYKIKGLKGTDLEWYNLVNESKY